MPTIPPEVLELRQANAQLRTQNRDLHQQAAALAEHVEILRVTIRDLRAEQTRLSETLATREPEGCAQIARIEEHARDLLARVERLEALR